MIHWTAPTDLQRPDWEPENPGGYVDLGYAQLHGMTCDDAKLIAAAPELLESLQMLYAATPDNEGGELGIACMKARQAIAKATGKEAE